jgi:restriction modification system DNA specificity subunit
MDSIKMTTEQQLPKGWKIERLGDIAITEKGKKPKSQSSEKTDTHCYPYVDIEAFEKGVIKSYTDGVKCVLCDEDDFLMVWDGSRSGLVGKGIKGALGSTLVRILLPDINNLYAYYFLLSKYKEINTRAKGSGTPHVDPDLLWNYAFPIPPNLETQQAIVNKIESLFDEIDEGIGRLKTAARQIQQYRQSLLKNAFNGELTKEWRSKHADALLSENELLAQIQTAREERHAQQLADWQTAVSQWEQNGKEGKKPSKPKAPTQAVKFEENFADLPRGWGVIRFENICDLIRNGISVKPEGESGIKILRISAVRPFQLNLDDYRFLNTDDVGDFVLNNGDLLFTRYNGTRNFVGVCAEFKSDEKYVYPDKLIRAVVNSTKINSTFLMYGFNTGISRKFIESRIRTTAGQSGISGTDIKAIPVVICSPAEQTQIVAILESKLTACDQLAAELSNQLKQAELLKQAVLKAAFSGNLLDK